MFGCQVLNNFIEDLKRRVNADLAAARDRAARQQEELMRKIGSPPRVVARKNDLQDPRNIGIILQWDDGKGNTIFTRTGLAEKPLGLEQIRTLSGKITDQKTAFDRLADQDKEKARAEDAQPYRDYLQSETLGRRFQALKQQSPAPR